MRPNFPPADGAPLRRVVPEMPGIVAAFSASSRLRLVINPLFAVTSFAVIALD